jgi:transposase
MTEGRDTDDQWRLSDERWRQISGLLPPEPTHARGGRPRQPARLMMEGTLFVLVTGCTWKSLPPRFGAPSTVYDHFQGWRDAGAFRRMTEHGLLPPELHAEVERRSRRTGEPRRSDAATLKGEDVETDSPTLSLLVAPDRGVDEMWISACTFGSVE